MSGARRESGLAAMQSCRQGPLGMRCMGFFMGTPRFRPLGFRKIQGAFLAVRPGECLSFETGRRPRPVFEKREPAKGREEGKNKRNEKGHGEKAEKYGLSRPWGLRRDAPMLQKGFERPFDRGELLWSSRNTEAKCRI